MKTLNSAVSGEPVKINVVETADDLPAFRDFVRANQRFLGLDTETTGLDIYSDEFRCRTVQFGNPREAYVLPVELGEEFREDARRTLQFVDGFVLHNASYDLQVIERRLLVPMEDLWPKVTDTRILAHLVDPRGKEEGGWGHSLEDLIRHYLDPEVADNVKGLMNKLRLELKTTKDKVFRLIPIDHPEFNLYAGMDTVFAARLMRKLIPMVPTTSEKLTPYEHQLAAICSYMERTGFLLDVEYTNQLSARLAGEEDAWKEKAADLGLDNVNSPVQVAEALMNLGVKIKGRTPTGNPQVDKKLLGELLAGDPEEKTTQLAQAISEAKKAGKWRKTWVQKFLDTRDSADRCHASINPLRARTARMSITGIPAQTLPAGDWMIRRCFLADPGHLIASVDYQAQELRVLAALSGDQTMIQAFRDGLDLHLLTARAAFGEHIEKDDPERKYAKVVNFGRVYGGGAKTVAEQTGLAVPQAQIVVDGFDKAYPKVGVLSKRLAAEAGSRGFITTPVGRRLPVDPSRAYSALNYLIQSSSRDVTGAALVRLHEEGLTPYLRLPIHDEVLASVPEENAVEIAEEIGRIMTQQMGPVTVGTDPEVGGRSWGSLYGAEY